MRDVNGALKLGSRRQWKFELQLIVERDGAVGMYQHAFVGEVEHFTRRGIRTLDEPPCSLDREAEESAFLIHGPLFVGSVQSYRKVYARSGFPSCVFHCRKTSHGSLERQRHESNYSRFLNCGGRFWGGGADGAGPGLPNSKG